MAIRRVGGGLSCPNFLADTYNQVVFAQRIVFLVALLGTAIAFCALRTRTTAGRKLLGLPYLVTLLFFLIVYALGMLTTTLQACDQVGLTSFYSLGIVSAVFYGMACWWFLFVIVWTLNSMLRASLDHKSRAPKIVCQFIVVIMGLLTIVCTSLECYHIWLNTVDGLYSNKPSFISEYIRIRLAFWVMYLASVLISGVFALLAVQSMRSKHVYGGALQGWIAALIASVSIWCLIAIMQLAKLINWEVWELIPTIILQWISNFCLVLGLVLVIVVARNVAWNRYAEHDAERYTADVHGQPTHGYQRGYTAEH